MKKVQVMDYNISIQLEPPYSFHSSDNKQYDKAIILVEKDYEYSPKTISLRIEKNDCFKEIALIVLYSTLIDECILPAGEYLFP